MDWDRGDAGGGGYCDDDQIRDHHEAGDSMCKSYYGQGPAMENEDGHNMEAGMEGDSPDEDDEEDAEEDEERDVGGHHLGADGSGGNAPGNSSLGAFDALLEAAVDGGHANGASRHQVVAAGPHRGHDGGGYGGEISHAEQVLLAAQETAKQKPKKRDGKTWPAASRRVAHCEHEALCEDTRSWVLKIQKSYSISDTQLARWAGVPMNHFQEYMKGEVDPRVTNQLRRYISVRLENEKKKQQDAAEAETAANANGSAGVVDAVKKYKLKTDKVESVSIRDKAQGFDPYFLESLDSVTPIGGSLQLDTYVPIDIDIVEGNYTVRESLMWNLTDESLDPEAAAAILCKHAPVLLSSAITARVATSIREQIESYPRFAPPTRPKAPHLAEVKISVEVEGALLEDRLMWDLSDKSANPHAVAIVLCRDLGLPSHLVPIVSHQIWQQVAEKRRLLWKGDSSQHLPLPAHNSPVHTIEALDKWTPQIGGQLCIKVPAALPPPSCYAATEKEEHDLLVKEKKERMNAKADKARVKTTSGLSGPSLKVGLCDGENFSAERRPMVSMVDGEYRTGFDGIRNDESQVTLPKKKKRKSKHDAKAMESMPEGRDEMMIVDGLGMARNMAKSTTEHGRGGGHGMVERDSQSQRSSHENSVRWLRDVSASSSNWAQEGEGFNGVHHRHSHLPGETVAARSQGASRRSEGRCELPNGVNLLLSGSRGQDQLVSGRDKWAKMLPSLSDLGGLPGSPSILKGLQTGGGVPIGLGSSSFSSLLSTPDAYEKQALSQGGVSSSVGVGVPSSASAGGMSHFSAGLRGLLSGRGTSSNSSNTNTSGLIGGCLSTGILNSGGFNTGSLSTGALNSDVLSTGVLNSGGLNTSGLNTGALATELRNILGLRMGDGDAAPNDGAFNVHGLSSLLYNSPQASSSGAGVQVFGSQSLRFGQY